METWDAYNEKGEKAEIDLIRGEAIPEGLFHVVVEVIVIHKDGSYLLMQRSFDKPNYPGMYEAGASGSVIKGETFIEGAKRELREETGIISDNFRQLHYIVHEKKHTIYIGFLCQWDGEKDQIQLQENETISYRWVSETDFINFIDTNQFIQEQRIRLSNYISKIG